MSTGIVKGKKEKKKKLGICKIKTAMHQLSAQKGTLSANGG